MSNREDSTHRYLVDLAVRIGAHRAVLASADGLLVAGAGGPDDTLEELAAYAPSQLPAKVERPEGMGSRRVELGDQRLYLATDGAPPPAEAADDLAKLLKR